MDEIKEILIDVVNYDHTKWNSEDVPSILILNFFGVNEMTISTLTLLDKVEKSCDKCQVYFQNVCSEISNKIEKIKSRHENIKIIT